MKILALDPGVTTGYVIGQMTGQTTFDVLEAKVIPWETRFHDLLALIETKGLDVVVMEEFRLYKHAATSQVNSYFPSVRIIGAVEAFIYRYGAAVGHETKIVFQPASVRQNIDNKNIPMDHARAVVGVGPHILDAYKHLRYYVLVTRNKRSSRSA